MREAYSVHMLQISNVICKFSVFSTNSRLSSAYSNTFVLVLKTISDYKLNRMGKIIQFCAPRCISIFGQISLSHYLVASRKKQLLYLYLVGKDNVNSECLQVSHVLLSGKSAWALIANMSSLVSIPLRKRNWQLVRASSHFKYILLCIIFENTFSVWSIN